MKPFVVFVVRTVEQKMSNAQRLLPAIFSTARGTALHLVHAGFDAEPQTSDRSLPFWTWFTENPRPNAD